MHFRPTARCAVFGSISVLLTACGSGGSGSSFTPPPVATTWQSGVFASAASFKSSCEAPRSGINPATGSVYPDVAGTKFDEMNYLRSFSNDTYLWYDEITDRNPANYAAVLDYFDILKTNQTTPSGQPKDNFHFTYDSDEWYELSQTGVSAGYGAQFAIIRAESPREVLVAFVEPGSPAGTFPANLQRGASIESIDGFDIDTTSDAGIDALNAGLFPAAPGEVHTFTVRDTPSSPLRSITLTTASITTNPTPVVDVIESNFGRRVGYLLFNDHIATAEQALIDAVDQLNSGQGIDDLVLDLRYNSGGFLAIASELSYMIAGTDATVNKTFETLQFNDKYPTTNPITGQTLTPTPFYSNALGPPFNAPQGQPLPTLDLDRVAVITGPGTCSASEAIMNGLRGIGIEVLQIGATTCGKPYGFYAQDNCGTTYFTVQFRGINAAGFGDYANGFVPTENPLGDDDTRVQGCLVADDYTNALGDPAERRLSAALDYLEGRGCPPPSAIAPGTLGKARAPLNATDGLLLKEPGLQNRIMLP
ncbi:MAG: S41 family peptidase [Gammaproteobacteria bacterium]